MKGVLICGGLGTRLRPLTEITNKSLLPVYDKPLIQYPLETLLDADINDIIVISSPERMDQMAGFLGSGSRFGCTFSYRIQEEPAGIAHALGLAEDFADGDDVCAILGDNIYFDNISDIIKNFGGGGHIFVREVDDPERFGVVELDEEGTPVSIEEKPKQPKSNLAQTGCYIYDARCFDIIRELKPSWRNEFEITDVTKWYMNRGRLSVSKLSEEWIDAGTFESLHRAAVVVRERKLDAIQEAKKHAATPSVEQDIVRMEHQTS